MKTIPRSLYFVLFLLVFAFLYFSNIATNHILNYDDALLLNPLKNITSISQYIDSLFLGRIFDFQPLRDLSYFIDLKIMTLIPFYNHHFSNFLIALCILCVAYKILKLLFNDSFFVVIILFSFAFSPLSATSIAWIAARKHLLSFLFILLAYFNLLTFNPNDQRRNLIYISLFYLASLLSQPIHVFFPLIVLLYFYFKKYSMSEFKIFFFSLFVLLILFSVFNLYYYNEFFPRINAGISKFQENKLDFGITFLALGRYFFLSLFPFDALPTPHFEGAPQNLIGLFLMTVLFYFSYFKIKTHKNYTYLFLLIAFTISLVPVTLFSTRIFCSDTYLLLGSFLILIFIMLGIKESSFFKYRFVLIIIPISFFTYTYINYLPNFNSDLDFWKYTYSKEATPDSAASYAELLVGHDSEKAEVIIKRLKEWEPNLMALYPLAVKNVFYNPKLNNHLKLERLKNFKPHNGMLSFYLCILATNANDKKLFETEFHNFLNTPSDFLYNFSLQSEKSLAAISAAIKLNQLPDGDKLLEAFKGRFAFTSWNNELYLNYYNSHLKMGFIAY